MHEVGQKRPNGFTVFDNLGNVSEWLNDWAPVKGKQDYPERDPQGPGSGKYRVIRGEAWFGSSKSRLRVSSWVMGEPSHWSAYLGFRCVWEPEKP